LRALGILDGLVEDVPTANGEEEPAVVPDHLALIESRDLRPPKASQCEDQRHLMVRRLERADEDPEARPVTEPARVSLWSRRS
jgi:hypothetical protein